MALFLIYFEGFVRSENNFKNALHYAKQIVEFKKNGAVHAAIGNMYLHGKGTDRDIEKAKFHFNKALEYHHESSKYFVDIFKKMESEKKEKIMVIKSIAEFREEDFQDDIGAVLITLDDNIVFTGQTLYDRDTFLTIIKIMKDRLTEIDVIDSKKTNEVSVFSQICKQTANKLVYDHAAADDKNPERVKRTYTARCLIGAVLEERAVCVGIIEYFRNMCACRNIECNVISSKNHTYCQVKLKGSWYYFDLTNLINCIKLGYPPECFLMSEKIFLSEFPEFSPLKSQIKYSSELSFFEIRLIYLLEDFSREEQNQILENMERMRIENYSKYLESIFNIVTGKKILLADIKAAEQYMSKQVDNEKKLAIQHMCKNNK